MFDNPDRGIGSQSIHRKGAQISNAIPMSPNSKNRVGVLGRARSTLNSLGDVVWKPKTNSRNCEPISKQNSPPLNQRTLDFFTTWSLKKKPFESKSDSEILGSSNEQLADDAHYRYLGYSNRFNVFSKHNSGRPKPNVPVSPNGRSKKDKSPGEVENRSTPNRKLDRHLSQDEANKNMKPAAQYRSKKIDDLLEEDDEMYANRAIRRSYDDNMNYIHNDDDMLLKEKRRVLGKMSLKESKYSGPQKENVETKKDDQIYKKSVIKARLKLQKISVNDDIVLNKSPWKRPSILFRHHSMDPNVSEGHAERLNLPVSNIDSDKNSIKKELARKRISFREPIILDNREIRSEAMERAKRFLDRYENKTARISPTSGTAKKEPETVRKTPEVVKEEYESEEDADMTDDDHYNSAEPSVKSGVSTVQSFH